MQLATPLKKKTSLQHGDWGKVPLPPSLPYFISRNENSLCLIRWLKSCHELVMGKALSPGHVTEHVSMKERGLEQGLEWRVG